MEKNGILENEFHHENIFLAELATRGQLFKINNVVTQRLIKILIVDITNTLLFSVEEKSKL